MFICHKCDHDNAPVLGEQFILQELEDQFNIELDLYDNGKYLQLSKIKVKKEDRDKGIGSKVMSRITDYADTQNLKIYGGFAGTETLVSDRVLGTNETILSGDLQGNDVNVADFIANYGNTTRNADNSYHVINIKATAKNLVLDGITVSDAHNNLNATESGGAIIKHKIVAKLVLKNCIVKDNVSRNGNAGLLAEFELNNTSGTRGALVIENTKFINNMARWASGIYSFARANSNVDITIANSLFDNNLSGNLNTTTATGLSGSAFWFIRISSKFFNCY